MHVLPLAGPVTFAAASRRFRRTVDLDCTPDALFDVFEDADAWPRWAGPIMRVEWTSPLPPRVGTTRTVELAGGVTVTERFTAYDRPHHLQFVFTSMSTPGLAAFGEDYRVTTLPAGRCRLTWTVVMEPTGAMRAIMPLTGWTTGPALGRILVKLRAYVADGLVD